MERFWQCHREPKRRKASLHTLLDIVKFESGIFGKNNKHSTSNTHSHHPQITDILSFFNMYIQKKNPFKKSGFGLIATMAIRVEEFSCGGIQN